MTKKIDWKEMENPLMHSQKTSDGQSQAVKSGGLKYPGIRLGTMGMILNSTKAAINNLLEELEFREGTRATLILSDNIELVRALYIKYGDTPLVEVIDMLLDEAHDNHVKMARLHLGIQAYAEQKKEKEKEDK